MSNNSVIKVAEAAAIRIHNQYGEVVRLLKNKPSATGGIYRQSRKQYSAPYEIKGCVSREPHKEMVSMIGEASERVAHITIPVSFARDLFGADERVEDMITASDLFVFDERVWRVIQCAPSGRVGTEPLIYDIDLREKIGAKEEEYL
jgi:hypothetical protein